MQICVCQLLPVRSSATGEQPFRILELKDGSAACETNMPLTHREHTDSSSQPATAITKAPPAVIIYCSSRKKAAAVDSVAAGVMTQNTDT